MNVITSSEDNKKCYPCCWTLLLPMIPAAHGARINSPSGRKHVESPSLRGRAHLPAIESQLSVARDQVVERHATRLAPTRLESRCQPVWLRRSILGQFDASGRFPQGREGGPRQSSAAALRREARLVVLPLCCPGTLHSAPEATLRRPQDREGSRCGEVYEIVARKPTRVAI
jgi:hypothetical protein